MRGVMFVIVAVGHVAVAAAEPTPSDLAVATRAIIGALNSGDVTSIQTYLDTGRVKITMTCEECGDPKRIKPEVLTRSAFIEFVRRADQRLERGPHEFHVPEEMQCNSRCCSGSTGPLQHDQLFVTQVCFRPGAKLGSITYFFAN